MLDTGGGGIKYSPHGRTGGVSSYTRTRTHTSREHHVCLPALLNIVQFLPRLAKNACIPYYPVSKIAGEAFVVRRSKSQLSLVEFSGCYNEPCPLPAVPLDRCTSQENWKRKQEDEIEAKRREIDREEAMLQRQLRAETIRRANDKLYEQTSKMKLLRSNLL